MRQSSTVGDVRLIGAIAQLATDLNCAALDDKLISAFLAGTRDVRVRSKAAVHVEAT
jgi:hypothetical protein